MIVNRSRFQSSVAGLFQRMHIPWLEFQNPVAAPFQCTHVAELECDAQFWNMKRNSHLLVILQLTAVHCIQGMCWHISVMNIKIDKNTLVYCYRTEKGTNSEWRQYVKGFLKKIFGVIWNKVYITWENMWICRGFIDHSVAACRSTRI